MITYELAKQLKEAGFPQFLKVGDRYILDEYSPHNPVYIASEPPPKEYVKTPTLSELVEACGDEFENLYKLSNRWGCNTDEGYHPETVGKTPEIAVANLWLKLNS